MQCNMEIHSDHDNIGVNIICPLDKIASYVIRREDVINVLCAMKCTKLQKHWIIYVGESSAVLIEAIFDRHLWNEIWTKLQETFNCENPVPNKGIEEMRKELFPRLENYAQTCTTLCELPLSHGEMSAIQPSGKFSAYHYCKDPKRIDISIFLDNDYQETSLQ